MNWLTIDSSAFILSAIDHHWFGLIMGIGMKITENRIGI